jgi:hypothetical protein
MWLDIKLNFLLLLLYSIRQSYLQIGDRRRTAQGYIGIRNLTEI